MGASRSYALVQHEFRGCSIFSLQCRASLPMFLLLLPTFRVYIQRRFNLQKGPVSLWNSASGGWACRYCQRNVGPSITQISFLKSHGARSGYLWGRIQNLDFPDSVQPSIPLCGRTLFLQKCRLRDGKEKLAKVMEGFAWVMCVGFVLIISGLDILKFFIDEKFWVDHIWCLYCCLPMLS